MAAAGAVSEVRAVQMILHVAKLGKLFFRVSECGFGDALVVDGIHARDPSDGVIWGNRLTAFAVFLDDGLCFANLSLQKGFNLISTQLLHLIRSVQTPAAQNQG